MNGRIGNVQNTSGFTCFKEKGASVIDYIICQPKNMQQIADLCILSKLADSDHAPVTFKLHCNPKKTMQSHTQYEYNC